MLIALVSCLCKRASKRPKKRQNRRHLGFLNTENTVGLQTGEHDLEPKRGLKSTDLGVTVQCLAYYPLLYAQEGS